MVEWSDVGQNGSKLPGAEEEAKPGEHKSRACARRVLQQLQALPQPPLALRRHLQRPLVVRVEALEAPVRRSQPLALLSQSSDALGLVPRAAAAAAGAGCRSLGAPRLAHLPLEKGGFLGCCGFLVAGEWGRAAE